MHEHLARPCFRLGAFTATLSFFASCATAPRYAPAERRLDLASSERAATALEWGPVEPVPAEAQGRSARSDAELERRPEWRRGQSVLQGFLGVTDYQSIEVEGSGGIGVDGDAGQVDTLPLLGGGVQHKLGGERLDYGLEGFFSFSGRADAAAFVVGGGGATVAVDVNLFILELYGGAFASVFLGDKVRLYGGAGPLLQWASYDQRGSTFDDSGTGFGYGYYARAGIEFVLASRTMVGFGARWSDSRVDLGGSLGDLDVEGLQMVFTVSKGL
ncbi:MAG: outer membrane beta-barrel protein [Planctomycetes bacterium]|nr:outer membrane beta-barrel protein [Planctomycetota bacterium]